MAICASCGRTFQPPPWVQSAAVCRDCYHGAPPTAGGRPSTDVRLHPNRAAILAALKLHRVLNFCALSRLLGMAGGTLSHHLRVLSRNGFIMESFERTRRLVRLPHLDLDEAERMHLLRQDGLAALLAIVAARPRFQRDLFAAMPDVPRSTIQHRIGRLVDHGLVKAIPQGRLLRYELVE